MSLLQFLLLYLLPALVCVVWSVAMIRKDGYVRLDELAKLVFFALCPIVNIFSCVWVAGLGLALAGSQIHWGHLVWERKKKPRP
jgi:hypothetical protein